MNLKTILIHTQSKLFDENNERLTLIEILVALLAASIISIMSFEFLSNSVFLKERVDANIKRDSDHMNTINTIRLDLMQAVPFDMKDQNGRELKVSFVGNSLNRL